jgi:hypothetical protein
MSLTSLQIALGLVTFDDSVTVDCPITHVLEDFKVDLENIGSSGETSLWDGIQCAADLLSSYKEERLLVLGQGGVPPRLRIIALTDGIDTQSACSADNVVTSLRARGIILDAVVVNAINFELPACAQLCGGHTILPPTPETALGAFEADSMLALSWRAPVPIPPKATKVRQLAHQLKEQWRAAKTHSKGDPHLMVEEAAVLFAALPAPLPMAPASCCPSTSSTVQDIVNSTLGATASSPQGRVATAGGGGSLLAIIKQQRIS